MAAEAEEKSGKKKPWKWKTKGDRFQVGNREKGQAFADLRKKKALKEYKKLLRRTRQQGKPVLSGEKVPFSSVNSIQEVQQSSKSHQHLASEGTDATLNNLVKLNTGDDKGFGHLGHKRRKRRTENVSRYASAENDHKRRKQEKEEQLKILEEKRKKRDQELMEKVKKRRENYAKLNRRTKRGQPIMSNHMNYLLEKIQSQSKS